MSAPTLFFSSQKTIHPSLIQFFILLFRMRFPIILILLLYHVIFIFPVSIQKNHKFLYVYDVRVLGIPQHL